MALRLALLSLLGILANAQSINPSVVTADYAVFAPGDDFVICAEDVPFYSLSSGVSFTWRSSDGDFNAKTSDGVVRWDDNVHNQECPAGKCCLMIFEGSGDLVQFNYDSNGGAFAYWSTGTGGQNATELVLQNKPPYLHINNADGYLLWSSS